MKKLLYLISIGISINAFSFGPRPVEEPEPDNAVTRAKKQIKIIQAIGTASVFSSLSIDIPEYLLRPMTMELEPDQIQDFTWSSIEFESVFSGVKVKGLTLPTGSLKFVRDEAVTYWPRPTGPVEIGDILNLPKFNSPNFPYNPPVVLSGADVNTPDAHGMFRSTLGIRKLDVIIDVYIVVQNLTYIPTGTVLPELRLKRQIKIKLEDANIPVDIHAFENKPLVFINPPYRGSFNVRKTRIDIQGLPSIANKFLTMLASDDLAKIAIEAIMYQAFPLY